jgi:hypothetical protein
MLAWDAVTVAGVAGVMDGYVAGPDVVAEYVAGLAAGVVGVAAVCQLEG